MHLVMHNCVLSLWVYGLYYAQAYITLGGHEFEGKRVVFYLLFSKGFLDRLHKQ